MPSAMFAGTTQMCIPTANDISCIDVSDCPCGNNFKQLTKEEVSPQDVDLCQS